MWVLRKFLNQMEAAESMEFLLTRMQATKTNEEFFESMKRS